MNSGLFIGLSIVYVFVCLFLILVVLLQSGRGGMGAAFGGGSTQTVFGGAGAGNFLTRVTSVSAIAFLLLSGVLAYLSSENDQALEQAAQGVKKASAKPKGASTPPKKAPQPKPN